MKWKDSKKCCKVLQMMRSREVRRQKTEARRKNANGERARMVDGMKKLHGDPLFCAIESLNHRVIESLMMQ